MFLRRFEILGGKKKHAFSFHAKQFDAIDYGTNDNPIHHGKKVSLVCYVDDNSYMKYAEHLQVIAFETELFGELDHFTVSETESNTTIVSSLLHCISADKPMTSLANVTDGMSHHRRVKHFRTSRKIMRGVAKALSKLHGGNIIHGSVHSHNVGKFGQRWKLIDLPGSVVTSELFAACRLGLHSPPEAFVLARCKTNHKRSIAVLAPSLVAEPTVDVWAFGKLLYEVLVGESLFKDFMENGSNINASKCILTWNDKRLGKVSGKLSSEGIAATGVDLILNCLSPLRSTRFQTMSDILDHPFWRDENGQCTSVKLN
jgi:serine/threonine protein kinase